MVRGTSVYRIITDHLGSVRLVVDVTMTTTPPGDVSQRIAQRIDYDVCGKIIRDNAPRGWKVPFGFAPGRA